MDLASNVRDHFQAGFGAISVATLEESRCLLELRKAAAELHQKSMRLEIGRPTYLLICYPKTGFVQIGHSAEDTLSAAQLPVPKSFDEAIAQITSVQFLGGANALVVMPDYHPYLEREPSYRRVLKQVIEGEALNNRDLQRMLVFVQAADKIHEDIDPYLAGIPFPMPDLAYLRTMVRAITGQVTEVDESQQYRLAQALQGLRSKDAADTLALCSVRHKSFGPEVLPTIETAKASVLAKTAGLTYVSREELGDVELGGYDVLEKHIALQAMATSREAEEAHLDYPKGICLVGCPGTGKSVCVRTIAKLLQLPLVELDFASLFDKFVGASEQRMRAAIDTVTALGGCVLMVDEADKALGSAHEAGGDSGTTQRVFGQLLSWLARKQDRTFVVMTMNRVDGMPPELLRPGRFDKIFYVDLPNEDERKQIFAIHMKRRGVAVESYSKADFTKLAKATVDFSGAEIEAAVKSARLASFHANPAKKGHPSIDELVAAVKATKPMAQLDPQGIDSIRKFGRNGPTPVSSCLLSPSQSSSRNVSLS